MKEEKKRNLFHKPTFIHSSYFIGKELNNTMTSQQTELLCSFFFFQLRKVSIRIILNLSKITIYLPTQEDDENSKKENLEYSIQKQF